MSPLPDGWIARAWRDYQAAHGGEPGAVRVNPDDARLTPIDEQAMPGAYVIDAESVFGVPIIPDPSLEPGEIRLETPAEVAHRRREEDLRSSIAADAPPRTIAVRPFTPDEPLDTRGL